MDIMDHRPPEHEPGAAADCLQHPAGEKNRDVGGGGAKARSCAVEREPDEQEGPSAETVREGTVRELAGR